MHNSVGYIQESFIIMISQNRPTLERCSKGYFSLESMPTYLCYSWGEPEQFPH